MDSELASAVLEFLLRHGVSDHVLKNAIRVIPFPESNSRLKKSMFLRKIQSEIDKGSVSEDILEYLECIEELEHREEIPASEAMKRAYCAVAVECVVRCLSDGDEEWGYFNAVKRIWRGRVSTMEMSENVGLLSDELRIWKEEIELAIWDPNAGENLRLKSKEINALQAVRAYVAEAWSSMGPSKLEGDDIKIWGVTDTSPEQAGQGDLCLPNSLRDSAVSNGTNGKQRGLRRKHVAVKHSRGASRTSRAKMVAEEMVVQISWNNHGPEPNPEINEVRKPPQASLSELKAVLQDHLRDAPQISMCMNDNMVRENMCEEPSVEGKTGVDVYLASSCDAKRDTAAPIRDTSLENELPIGTNRLEQKVVAEDSNSDTAEFHETIIATAVRENTIEDPSVDGNITIDSKLLSPYVRKGVEDALMKDANVKNGQSSETSGVEHKVPLPSPVGERTDATPINEIALDNQQPIRENSLKLKVALEDPCSDALQLTEHRTVCMVRDGLNEKPSLERQDKVDSRRSLNRCVKKSVQATVVNEIDLEGQLPKETNCSELNDRVEASPPDLLLFSDKSIPGMVSENMEKERTAEIQNDAESRPHGPLLEKIIEATLANEANLDGQQKVQTSMEPKASTKDLFPDASRFPGNASSTTCGENMDLEPTEIGKKKPDLGGHINYIGKKVSEATVSEEVCLHCQHCRNQDNKPKPSFMERKKTCHTYEWDDSVSASAVDSPKHEDKPHVPSPKRKAVSPLRKNENNRVGRRKVRRWSTLEEDTLRAAVKKYDIGNWKLILNSYSAIFEGRTAVDLKDKWRNMVRYNAV